MDGDLTVCSHQVDLGKDETTEKLMGVVMDMTDGLAIGNGPGVECPVGATGSPTVVLLGYDV
jgi:hypothetical protein